MSEENVEIVRRALEANRSGPPDATVEVVKELAHPDFEFTSRLSSIEGSTYRGPDGLRRYFEDMADAFQEWRNDVNEMTEVGPDTVLADITFHATGHSGVAVELQSFVACVLSSGKIVRIHAYPSRREALEAAGLSE
jgi:ketosteroid isomerase-like protein